MKLRLFGMTIRKLLLPITIFLGLSFTLYLVTLVTVPWISSSALAQMVSAILVLPLFFWFRKHRGPQPASSSPSALRRVLLGITAVFLLVMIVRTPFVAFLQNPLEKTPLIYLLVLMIVLFEKKPLAFFGLNTTNLRKQISLGLFLLSIYVIVPGVAITTVFFLLHNVNLVAGYGLSAFILAIPFQVLAVGISEEGLFRGYFQTKLASTTTIRKAILIQAGFFGLWHFVWHINPLNWGGMALHIGSTFLFGLLAGTYFRYIGSISGLAVFHGLSNSLADGLDIDPTQLPFSIDLLGIAFGALILAANIALIIFARRVTSFFRFRRSRSDAQQPAVSASTSSESS